MKRIFLIIYGLLVWASIYGQGNTQFQKDAAAAEAALKGMGKSEAQQAERNSTGIHRNASDWFKEQALASARREDANRKQVEEWSKSLGTNRGNNSSSSTSTSSRSSYGNSYSVGSYNYTTKINIVNNKKFEKETQKNQVDFQKLKKFMEFYNKQKNNPAALGNASEKDITRNWLERLVITTYGNLLTNDEIRDIQNKLNEGNRNNVIIEDFAGCVFNQSSANGAKREILANLAKLADNYADRHKFGYKIKIEESNNNKNKKDIWGKGEYEHSSKTIYINDDLLFNSNSAIPVYEIVYVVIHEMNHSYQHHQVDKLKKELDNIYGKDGTQTAIIGLKKEIIMISLNEKYNETSFTDKKKFYQDQLQVYEEKFIKQEEELREKGKKLGFKENEINDIKMWYKEFTEYKNYGARLSELDNLVKIARNAKDVEAERQSIIKLRKEWDEYVNLNVEKSANKSALSSIILAQKKYKWDIITIQ